MSASSTSPEVARALDRVISGLHGRRLRVWSIVISFFGDSVVPRGGTVWLGVIREMMEALRIESGTLGAAMSRLTADGWLERTRDGKLSYYRLADAGRRTFENAARRIYSSSLIEGSPEWDGTWTLALLPDAQADAQRKMVDAGFGRLDARLWVRPSSGGPLPAGALRFEGARATEGELQSAVWAAWDLDRVGRGYRRFLECFEPLVLALEGGAPIHPRDAIGARTLLIHEYRRQVLKDPRLPVGLLPSEWPGRPAHALARRGYLALLEPSEAWLSHPERTTSGALPEPDPSFHRRFGGLGAE